MLVDVALFRLIWASLKFPSILTRVPTPFFRNYYTLRAYGFLITFPIKINHMFVKIPTKKIVSKHVTRISLPRPRDSSLDD